MSWYYTVVLLTCVAVAYVAYEYQQFHANDEESTPDQLNNKNINSKDNFDKKPTDSPMAQKICNEKEEDIVKLLEVCDFKRLYDIKDTIAAFNVFEEIIADCINFKDTHYVSKDENETNNNNDNPNLALLHIESTPAASLNKVNTFFSTLGERLSRNVLEKANTTELNLAKLVEIGSVQSSFELKQTNEEEILEVLQRFHKKRHLNHDSVLSYNVIVKAKHILAPPIVYITNLSFASGTVPDSIKVAVIVPKLKAGDTKDPSNYRPLSHANAISEVIEKVVKKQIRQFVNSNNLISDHQFGFRSGRSTKTAIAEMVNHITTKLDSGQKCIGIFLDLLKAFDTISHPILLRKMEAVGIRGQSLKWFKSFFENRKQKLYIGNKYSDVLPVKYGIPQGSPMGPHLFSLFVNDLLQLDLPQTKPIAYVDDTVLITHADTWEIATKIGQKNLEGVNKWLQDNIMSFNLLKTKVLAFSFSNLTAPKEPISIRITDCNKHTLECKPMELKQEHSTKYIGSIIDENLSSFKKQK